MMTSMASYKIVFGLIVVNFHSFFRFEPTCKLQQSSSLLNNQLITDVMFHFLIFPSDIVDF